MTELDWARVPRLAAAAAAFAVLGVTASTASAATIARASDWLGSIVLTQSGDEVGTIRDFGIDETTGHVEYIVVSVGSFLIENNLIAVRPDALVPEGDHRFVLQADLEQLKKATRFASDRAWPARADVVRSTKVAAPIPHEEPAPDAAPANANASADAQATGTATISSKSKLAYLSADERYVKEVEKPATTKPTATTALPPIIESKPQTTTDPAAQAARSSSDARFDQLDRDHDGVLNRAEIATEMGPKDKYSKLDVNADGVIERDEFEAFAKERASP